MSGDKQQNPGSDKEKINPKFAQFLIESLQALGTEDGDKELLEARARKLIKDAVGSDYIVMAGDEYVPKSDDPKKRQLGEKICAAITASGLDFVADGDKPNKKSAKQVDKSAENEPAKVIPAEEPTETKTVETAMPTTETNEVETETGKPVGSARATTDAESSPVPKKETALEGVRRKLINRILEIESDDNNLQHEVLSLSVVVTQIEQGIREDVDKIANIAAQPSGGLIIQNKRETYENMVISAQIKELEGEDYQEALEALMSGDELFILFDDIDNKQEQLKFAQRQLYLKQIEFCVHHFKLQSAKMLRANTEAENGQILQEHLVGAGAIDRALQARLKRSALVDGAEVNTEATLAGLDYIDWENPENNELLLKLLELMEQGKLVVSKESNRLYSPGNLKKDDVEAIRRQMTDLNEIQGTRAALELFGASDEIKAKSAHKRYSTALTTLKIEKSEYFVNNKKEFKITQTSGLKDILRLSNNEELILKTKDLISREIIVFDSTGDLVPNKSLMELDKNDERSGYINSDKEYEDLCKEILESLKAEQHNLTEKELQKQIDLDPVNVASLTELEGLQMRLIGLKDELGLPNIGDKPSLRTRSNMRILHVGITDKQVQLSREYMDLLADYKEKSAARTNYVDALKLKIKSVAKARSDSVESLAGISALQPVTYDSICDVTQRFEVCDQENFDLGEYRFKLATMIGVDTESYKAVLSKTEVMETSAKLVPDFLDMAKRSAFNDVLPIVNHELRKNNLLNDESKHETIQGITGLFLQLDEVTSVMDAYEENVVTQEAYINYLKHLIVNANITENQSEQVRLVSAELEILKLEKLKLDTQLSFVISTRANQLKGDILQDKLGNPSKYGVKKEELEVFEFIKGQISSSATETAATVRSVDKQASAAIGAVSSNYDDWSDSDTSSNYRAHSASHASSLGGSSSRLTKNNMKQGFLGGLAEVFGVGWVVGR